MNTSVFSQSRFARKVLLLFVVCAVVPILGISLYAFRDLTNTIDRQLETDVANTARGIGQGLVERLVLAERRLQAIDVAAFEPNDIFAKLTALPTSRQSTLEGFTSLATVYDPQAEQAIVQLKQISSTRQLTAELQPEFLAVVGTMVPLETRYCSLTSANEVIFCSDAEAKKVVAGGLDLVGQSGTSRVNFGEQQFVTAHWSLFLDAHFKSPSWKIVALRSRSAELENYNALRVFPLLVALALAVAVVLSLTQIRRGMRPMQQLLQATKRIAQQDFSTPLAIVSGDEFQQLGDSFNQMSGDLRRQFDRLQVFSQLDHRILQSGLIDDVSEWVLLQLSQLMNFNSAALVVARPDGGFMINSIGADSASIDSPQRSLEPLPDWLASTEYAGLHRLAAEPSTIDHLRVLQQHPGNQQLSVVCISQGDELLGLFAVGFVSRQQQEAAAETLLELRDRLAVALSSLRREEALFDQAHFDQLTKLPNRFLFIDRLEQELARARHHRSRVGVLFLDLDRFKNVNDSLGHSTGDELLVSVAERLQTCLRDADTAARMGGDEFTVLLPDLSGDDDATILADRIVEALAYPFTVAEQQVYVTASIGIAVFPDDGDSTELLLRNADSAMYLAKDMGRAGVAYYSKRLSERAKRRLDVETRLRNAVRHGLFELLFQPQYSAENGAICGAEALIRIEDGDPSPPSAGEFIPIAEQTGLIQAVGKWAAEAACGLLADVQSNGLSLAKLAVNASPIELRDPQFAKQLSAVAASYGVDPSVLAIEITETALVDQFDETRETLNQLAELGCQIVLDDFGTGHSSLRYLQQFPIHVLKLDRAFVVNAVVNERDRALAAAIVTLAHNLGKPVVAEGVETDEQLALMRELGCEMIQGYLLSKPITAAEFCHQLARR